MTTSVGLAEPPPHLSIITVCRNAEQTIGQCIDSVEHQSFVSLEHIIIDGASTDQTVDRVKQKQERSNSKIREFVSEPDKGIYDAMNKGIARARGKWLYFLNADDRLFSQHCIEHLFASLPTNEQDDADVIFARLLIFDQSTGCGSIHAPRSLSFQRICSSGVYQQAWLAQSRTFKSIGVFDATLRLCGDIDWLSRAVANDCTAIASNVLVGQFHTGGASGDFSAVKQEHRLVERRHLSLVKWTSCKALKRIAIFCKSTLNFFLGKCLE